MQDVLRDGTRYVCGRRRLRARAVAGHFGAKGVGVAHLAPAHGGVWALGRFGHMWALRTSHYPSFPRTEVRRCPKSTLLASTKPSRRWGYSAKVPRARTPPPPDDLSTYERGSMEFLAPHVPLGCKASRGRCDGEKDTIDTMLQVAHNLHNVPETPIVLAWTRSKNLTAHSHVRNVVSCWQLLELLRGIREATSILTAHSRASAEAWHQAVAKCHHISNISSKLRWMFVVCTQLLHSAERFSLRRALSVISEFPPRRLGSILIVQMIQI